MFRAYLWLFVMYVIVLGGLLFGVVSLICLCGLICLWLVVYIVALFVLIGVVCMIGVWVSGCLFYD